MRCLAEALVLVPRGQAALRGCGAQPLGGEQGGSRRDVGQKLTGRGSHRAQTWTVFLATQPRAPNPIETLPPELLRTCPSLVCERTCLPPTGDLEGHQLTPPPTKECSPAPPLAVLQAWPDPGSLEAKSLLPHSAPVMWCVLYEAQPTLNTHPTSLHTPKPRWMPGRGGLSFPLHRLSDT